MGMNNRNGNSGNFGCGLTVLLLLLTFSALVVLSTRDGVYEYPHEEFFLIRHEYNGTVQEFTSRGTVYTSFTNWSFIDAKTNQQVWITGGVLTIKKIVKNERDAIMTESSEK